MADSFYSEKIEALLKGEITELIVEKKNFDQFRAVWSNHPEKKQIIGEASLGGKVIYRKSS